MAIYVHPIKKVAGGQSWTHLTADSLEELHESAQSIEITRTWFYEATETVAAHYKLAPSHRQRAIEAGAIEIPLKTLYVLRGHSGSGKSTLAEKIVKESAIYAADKYPKAYDDKGNYQASEQAASHKWCKNQLLDAIARNEPEIVFANTNMKTDYFMNIAKQAISSGYTVQFILCEDLFGPDGQRLPNAHKTPAAVITHQINQLELINPPTPGISIEETLKANSCIMSHLMSGDTPSIIACDLINTLVVPNGTSPFVNKASHVKLNEPVIRQLKRLGYKRLTVCSNQMGAGYGHMSIDDLAEIADTTQAILDAHQFKIEQMLFATKRNSPVCWIYQNGEMKETTLKSNADKPHYGMLEHLLSANSGNVTNGVYIGDAHHTGRTEDIETIRRVADNRFTYIPVEALTYLND